MSRRRRTANRVEPGGARFRPLVPITVIPGSKIERVRAMSRRPALITQADIARVIRAAKQAGAAKVVVKIGDQSVIVRLTPSTGADVPLAPEAEIVL
jgi:hypothetical protein